MNQTTNEQSAPSSWLLKRSVHGRTVNVHAHLLSMTWWPTDPVRPTGWEATPGERQYAQEARERRCDWMDTIIKHAGDEGRPFSDEDLELFFSENALRLIYQNRTSDVHDV